MQSAITFLHEAAEQQRQNELQNNPLASIEVLRGAFRVGRGLTVVFAPESKGVTATVTGQAQQLGVLAQTLDKLQHLDLGGMRIVVGGGASLDRSQLAGSTRVHSARQRDREKTNSLLE